MRQPTSIISKVKDLCLRFWCVFFLLPALHCCIPVPSHALTVEHIPFADRTTIGGKPLPLRNAALLHYLKFLMAYVAALYLPEGVKAEDVLSDVPKRLEISYLVSIKGPDFDKGAAPVLERNQTPAELAKLQRRIDRINAAYKDVKPGDRYSLTYLPGRGTELALNGTPLIIIEGADFAAAYFGIWLGREPIDAKLKRDLLKGR
ncbi:MAG: chalcone isomerase family protein [Desulfuromonadales bacterium]|nr:chalcone isomerase family protein [Desulfuromonadales bacterium]